MALQVTLTALRTRVRRLTDQENSDFVSDAEIDEEINQGVREFWQAMTMANPDWYLLSISLETTTGTLEYNVFDEVADWTLVRGVDLATDASHPRTLRQYQFAERNQRRGNWPIGGALPRYRVIRNGIDGETATIAFDIDPGDNTYTVHYIPAPPALDGDNTTLDGVLGFEDWPVHHACVYVRNKADEPEAAQLHLAKVAEVKARVAELASLRHMDGAPRIARTRNRFREDWIHGE